MNLRLVYASRRPGLPPIMRPPWAWMLMCGVLLTGCTASYPVRNPVGQVVPTVVGRSLKDQPVVLPDHVSGRVSVLLVVYDRAAHDDVRPWADTLARDLPGVLPLEVGAVLSPWLGWHRQTLLERLRDKTPSVLRGQIVLLHDEDAQALARFTGTREPERLRVLLLDETGRVLFFNADGHNPHSARWLAEAYADYQQRSAIDRAAGADQPATDRP